MLLDGVCLEKDWDNIETIVIDSSFDLAFKDEIENLNVSNKEGYLLTSLKNLYGGRKRAKKD